MPTQFFSRTCIALVAASAWSCSGGDSGNPASSDAGADAGAGGTSGAGGVGGTAGAAGLGGGATGGGAGSGGAATGGAGGSSGTSGGAGSSGAGGTELCGCTEAAAVDLTAETLAEIGFGFSYSPKCIKLKVGASVTWNGPFFSHPLSPYTALGTQPNPIPPTDSGSSMTYTFESAGAFGYYCTLHGGEAETSAGMCGAVFVLP
jgi:plastocyanin